MSTNLPADSNVQRIVVTRLRFLGDVILTLPLVDALRSLYPQASIEYLLAAPFDQLLTGHPSIDRVHVLPSDASWRDTLSIVRDLRSPRIDWWIDLFTNPRSCVIGALSNPRHSVGNDSGLRARLYEYRLDRPPGDPSAIRHHLAKLEPIVGERFEDHVAMPRLRLDEAELDQARRRHGIDSSAPPVLVHAGSTWPDKAWPVDSWVQLIAEMEASGIGPMWLITPPGEEDMVKGLAVRTGLRRIDSLPLRELLALVASARLYVGNDGGIMHAAVALSRPTVALFGPTEPEIWFPYAAHGPYRVIHRYNDQGPCPVHQVDHVSRLAHVEVHEVLDAVREVLTED